MGKYTDKLKEELIDNIVWLIMTTELVTLGIVAILAI